MKLKFVKRNHSEECICGQVGMKCNCVFTLVETESQRETEKVTMDSRNRL